MILSSSITRLVSCDFHNLLECSKYALHISKVHFYKIDCFDSMPHVVLIEIVRRTLRMVETYVKDMLKNDK